jgi:hypothetical protein
VAEPGPSFASHPAEHAGVPPQSHGDEIIHIDREGAVDLGGLRQVGDVLRRNSVALDAAGERLEQADDAFEEGRFARAVRPTTATSAPLATSPSR